MRASVACVLLLSVLALNLPASAEDPTTRELCLGFLASHIRLREPFKSWPRISSTDVKIHAHTYRPKAGVLNCFFSFGPAENRTYAHFLIGQGRIIGVRLNVADAVMVPMSQPN